jgi:hypothetical protein
MDKKKVYEALDISMLKDWLNTSFREVGISSLELLANDKVIDKAAERAYKKIPKFPYRAILKATIGEEGFTQLVYKIRDGMLKRKSIEFEWLTVDTLKKLLSEIKKE